MNGAAPSFDHEAYWSERYRVIDLTRSGHIDLPEAYNRWLYRRKCECLLRDLRRVGFRPRGASVLEIATGTGVYVDAWKRQGVGRLVGIDFSAAATEALRGRFPEFTFHQRDLAEPGLADVTGKGFDLVTAVDMLYHIVENERFPQAFANLADTVRPGGLLAIHDYFSRRGELDFGYLKRRPFESYAAALDSAGFDIVSRTSTFFFSVQADNIADPDWRMRLHTLWKKFMLPRIYRSPNLAGVVLYWVDRILGTCLRQGPSFEMLVCRRRP